jgi:hypothetical protein
LSLAPDSSSYSAPYQASLLSPTARFDDKTRRSGPYRPLHHATCAIAQKLGNEGIPGDLEVLAKPYQPDELAQKLRFVINR